MARTFVMIRASALDAMAGSAEPHARGGRAPLFIGRTVTSLLAHNGAHESVAPQYNRCVINYSAPARS